jgi:hypothetical protein
LLPGPRPSRLGISLRKQVLIGGAVWGIVLAGLFYLPGLIVFQMLGFDPMGQNGLDYSRYLFVMPIFVALAFGFWLRDIEASIKALVVAEIVEWVVVIGIVLNSDVQNFLSSSLIQSVQTIFPFSSPQDLGVVFLVLAGFMISSFFLGLLACSIGSAVRGHFADRRRERMDSLLKRPIRP